MSDNRLETFSCEICTDRCKLDILDVNEEVLYRTPLFKGDAVEVKVLRAKGKGCK